MAWISVHEQVIGGKLRRLAKEIGCSQNEALGLLVRLWLWGINNADKIGRIIGAEECDIAEILTIGIDGRYSPEKVVEALVSTNWIDIDDGLYIHDWEEWQEQWYKAIEVRERNAARKRKERMRKRLGKSDGSLDGTDLQMELQKKGMEEVLQPTEAINSHEDEIKSCSSPMYTKDYEEFWDVYPRKVGKGDAYKKYQTRLKDGWSHEELLEAAKNYAGICERNKTEKKYIKHPKTFLSETIPFVDYLPQKNVGSEVSEIYDENDPYGDWR